MSCAICILICTSLCEAREKFSSNTTLTEVIGRKEPRLHFLMFSTAFVSLSLSIATFVDTFLSFLHFLLQYQQCSLKTSTQYMYYAYKQKACVAGKLKYIYKGAQ